MKEQLALMVEHGAIPYWIALSVGMVLIGLLYAALESNNKKIEKVKKYIKETMEELGFGDDE